jgi:hypothetical protein
LVNLKLTDEEVEYHGPIWGTLTGFIWKVGLRQSTAYLGVSSDAVEALRYKPAGQGSLEFFTDFILPASLWPGVDSASNRNEYRWSSLWGKGGRCVGLTTLPPSFADCLELLGTSTSCSPKGLCRPVMG